MEKCGPNPTEVVRGHRAWCQPALALPIGTDGSNSKGVRKHERSLVVVLGRQPTAEEIAELISGIDPDEHAESPYDRAVETLVNEALRNALENLSYRSRRVIELRYGLGGEPPCTLAEVGRAFNITRERIRQIENRSLKELQYLHEAQKPRGGGETIQALCGPRLRAAPTRPIGP
jgi:Sigma-70, region 4